MEKSISSDRLKKMSEEMHRMAKLLVPNTFPQVEFQEEQEVVILKQKQVTIDGYDLTVCFSEADYGDHTLFSLQIQSEDCPFVPFSLVCKIGKAFLGSKSLSYIDFFKNNKKVYCWTIKKRDDKVIRPEKKTKAANYQGFKYRILNPGSVDLF